MRCALDLEIISILMHVSRAYLGPRACALLTGRRELRLHVNRHGKLRRPRGVRAERKERERIAEARRVFGFLEDSEGHAVII